MPTNDAVASAPGSPPDGLPAELDAEAVAPSRIGSKTIPAAAFAALAGRSLRTLRDWDEAGLTRPEVRRSRRYYDASDLAAVRAPGRGRRGPREGSIIKYIEADLDSGI